MSGVATLTRLEWDGEMIAIGALSPDREGVWGVIGPGVPLRGYPRLLAFTPSG